MNIWHFSNLLRDFLMKEYIDTITFKIMNKKQIREKFRVIVSESFKRGFYLVVERISPGFFEYCINKRKAMLADMKLLIFVCENEDDFNKLIRYLENISLWHVSTIRFWIGTKKLPDKIKESYNMKKFGFKEVQKNQIPEEIQNEIVGVIEPLDNELNLFGKSEFEKIVQSL